MGRPPAYLFVVRHGYRLDAADKQWHMSSPTPYDPPLTYNGWQQAKSLGVRIGSILRERVKEDERAANQTPNPSAPPARRKLKRYRVVLHSSPFLRCIQTAIAISAGLAQDSTPFAPASLRTADVPAPAADSSSRPRPTVLTGSPAPSAQAQKSVLRLDAFLGEWLSPNYFESITPPPESVMMLASAKADLLRREDYFQSPGYTSHTHSSSQGQLWSPTTARTSYFSPSPDGGSSDTGSAGGLANSLPTPSGASSNWSDVTLKTPSSARPGYVSPVPHYAVGNNNTIPLGYVSHARDACVMVDYQWHSTRGPLDWGDGGTFPEEWSDMHKRFRAGVQHLVDWYSTAENPTQPVTKTAATGRTDEAVNADGDDETETEAVVILVSHGAGCNALIGALTHQPVLMDVGMASLTMAVRKAEVANAINQPVLDSQTDEASQSAPPVHQLYDLKLFANTDHLRSPATTPTVSRSPSLSGALSGAMNSARSRHVSFSTVDGFSWNTSPGNRNGPPNAVLGSPRKSPDGGFTVPRLSFVTSNYNLSGGLASSTSMRPSNLRRSGLWSPSPSRYDDDDDDDEPVFPNFDLAMGGSTGSADVAPSPDRGRETSAKTNKENIALGGPVSTVAGISTERSPKPEPDQLGAGAGGLWGVPRPPDDADRLRDVSGFKRRWTVTERG